MERKNNGLVIIPKIEKYIELVFYAVARGLKKIFCFNLNGIKRKKEKGRKVKDMQLSLF